jgi:hypothetical protein
MSESVSFEMNFNAWVGVQVTDAGWDLYAKFYTDKNFNPVIYRGRVKTGEDGFSWFQLWDLMNIFGSGCFNGGKELFKQNVIRLPQSSFCAYSIPDAPAAPPNAVSTELPLNPEGEI